MEDEKAGEFARKKRKGKNIIIKGIRTVNEDYKVWAKRYIQEKLGVEVEVDEVRKSGNVFIIELGNVKQKQEV